MVRVAGTDDVVDLIPAPGTVYEEGTFRSKANDLSDPVAAMFGLGPDAVQNDVFSFLGKYNQHWWKRRTNSGYVENKGTAQNVVLYTISATGDGYSKFKVSDSVNISSTGVVSLNNPQTVTVSSSNSAALNGKYFEGNGYGDPGIFYGVSDLFWINQVSFGLTAQPVTAVQSGTVGEWGFVQSSDRNAYPDIGTENGYEYIYIGIPLGNAAQVPVKIATGSYTGTGTSDITSPNSLTFDFIPKIVLISGKTSWRSTGFFMKVNELGSDWVANGYKEDGYDGFFTTDVNHVANLNGTTLSWAYCGTNSAKVSQQLNNNGNVYDYIAIG